MLKERRVTSRRRGHRTAPCRITHRRKTRTRRIGPHPRKHSWERNLRTPPPTSRAVDVRPSRNTRCIIGNILKTRHPSSTLRNHLATVGTRQEQTGNTKSPASTSLTGLRELSPWKRYLTLYASPSSRTTLETAPAPPATKTHPSSISLLGLSPYRSYIRETPSHTLAKRRPLP